MIASRPEPVMRCALLLLLVVAAMPSAQGALTSLTVFGDSLSDTGTMAGVLEALGQPSVTPPPYYDGRFSNGPVYAERLGFPLASALLDGGTNYAVGGAMTASHVGGPLLTALSLEGQLARFRTDGGGVADPDELFILWIGGNDVRHAALGGDSLAGIDILGDALEVVEFALLDLQQMGARRILVPNLPDLGRTPEFTGDPALAASLSAYWNAGLADLVARNGSADLNLFDVNALFEELLADPAAYGLTNTTEQALLNPGADPDQFLYWDDIHPTARVHALLAQEMRPLIPEPHLPVLILFAGPMVLLRRTRRW